MKISNPLFRLLATNCALGTALGAAMVVGLLALDTARIRTLILGDESGYVAVFALLIAFMTMGASIMMGSAIMSHKDEDDHQTPRRGKGRIALDAHGQPIPVRVEAHAERRRR